MRGKSTRVTIKTHRDFVQAAGRHFQEAREQVLASGQSVLYARDGAIYRRHTDGREEFVKHIAPPTTVKPGTKIRIR